jgi:phosphate acetyltransferase
VLQKQAGGTRRTAELDSIMCRNGEAQAMMKGSLHTDHLMKAVMQRETGLRTSRR